MGVVGASLVALLIFLLWRFCIRRKGKTGGNMDQITPQYHPVPTIPENVTYVPVNDNSISMSDGATSHYGPGIQKCGSIIIFLSLFSNSCFKIVTVFMDLLSPWVMTEVPRRIVVYRPHSIQINPRHHYLVLKTFITILKDVFLVSWWRPTGRLSTAAIQI